MFDGIDAPCLNCANRMVDTARGYTCHSDCAAYQAYRTDRFELYEMRKNSVLNIDDVKDYKRDTRNRLRKRVHKK